MHFDYDPVKNRQNIQNHGIDFEDAKRIWDRPVYTEVDYRFEYEEVRFQTLGLMDTLVVILVVHTDYTEDGEEIIRIISARKALPRERKKYYAEIQSRSNP
jgi:uncharacterized DUF497 family protein